MIIIIIIYQNLLMPIKHFTILIKNLFKIIISKTNKIKYKISKNIYIYLYKNSE